jgi:hypothetical protein
MSLIDNLRNFNRYRKTPKFKNKAYRATMIFLIGTAAIQALFFFSLAPNFGKKSVEVD